MEFSILDIVINLKRNYIKFKYTGEMNRREFIKNGSSTVLGSTALSSIFVKNILAFPGNNSKEDVTMTCMDIANHFKEKGKWINWNKTSDTFKAGNPKKVVKKVAVAWKASWDALREAVSRNADLFISHESIFANSLNKSTEPEAVFALPSEKPKSEWLDKTGLVVYRCHDFWDRFPNEGIRDTWRAGLKIGDKIVVDEYPLYVTEVDPITVRDLANHVLKQIEPLRQNGIIVTGDLERKITKIGTGTGAAQQPYKMKKLGADVGIMSDDYYLHVRMGVHLRELDFPVIIVNHGVSEEWGIRNLADYVKREFPALEVFYIPQYCPYTVLLHQDE